MPSRSSGQALVEFTLIVPVLLLLAMLAVDFGRLFATYIAVNNAAREAATYASIHAADDPFDVDAYNSAAVAAGGTERNVQAQGDEGALSLSQPRCFTPGSGTMLACDAAADFATGIGNQVTVQAQQPFSFLTPLVGELFGGQLTLTASATAPVMNPEDVSIGDAPTPSPETTPTPDPDATPTPTPAPVDCTVPNFKNTFWNDPDALNTWHNVAGFTGTLTNLAGDARIKTQSLTKGSVVPCTSDMTVGP